MSIFSRRKYLFEADDDTKVQTDAPAEDNGATNVDTGTDDANNNEEADNQNQDNTEDNTDENEPDFGEEDNQDDDFNIDSGVDDDMTGNDNTDTGSDTNTGGGTDDTETVTVDKDSLKAKDKELFDSLSPQEQKMKTTALKELFVELYNNCDNIIDKFNSLASEYDEANEQIGRIISTIYCLKKMISDYLLNKFASSSYIENDIMFNNYLSVLNSIKNISTDLKNIYNNDNSGS